MAEQEYEEPQRVVVRDKRRVDPSGAVREPDAAPAAPAAAADGADEEAHSGAERVPDDATSTRSPEEVAADGFVELRMLQATLDERTADLQRLKAEFDNYRKRVERDRQLMAEQAVGGVLVHLLPVLDDLDRAREHGELTGGFKSVADALDGALAKLGLERFGDAGDRFDPMVHEAVTHQHSDDVTEATCVTVMRPGYRFADRLLRPAMVAVAEPQPEEATAE
jgi:molecular chaperone GrpE